MPNGSAATLTGNCPVTVKQIVCGIPPHELLTEHKKEIPDFFCVIKRCQTQKEGTLDVANLVGGEYDAPCVHCLWVMNMFYESEK